MEYILWRNNLNVSRFYAVDNNSIDDTWVIKGLQGDANSKLIICNRWGQPVFSSTGYSKP